MDTAAPARWIEGLENSEDLDGAVDFLEPRVELFFNTGTRGAVLRGDWLGHALHPALTDVVLGSWTSATILDVTGRGRWADAAQVLVGTGLIAFGPTAWSGWAQWAQAERPQKRVGVVHAVTSAAALSFYAASWFSRRKGHHVRGAGLSLVGAAVAGAGGYLGGHLAESFPVTTDAGAPIAG